jgi:competence protein ComEA
MKMTSKVIRGFVLVLTGLLVFSGIALAADDSMVNINTASLEELTTLTGVGEAIAQRIIEYREKIGPFTSIEQIKDVKGVGEKTFEKNKDKITVGASD